MNDVVVSVKHLTKEVALAQGNTLKVLDDISFDVNQGVFVSIVGPSGSGKSTLLYCISSLLPPSKGKILIKGKSPYEWRASKLAKFRRKEIGFIFQDFQLVSSYGDLPLIRILPLEGGNRLITFLGTSLFAIPLLRVAFLGGGDLSKANWTVNILLTFGVFGIFFLCLTLVYWSERTHRKAYVNE